MQGGYANLKQSYDNYKFVGSLEKRFFDDQDFGVFVQGSMERRNLSSNVLGVAYSLRDKTHGDAGIPDLTSMNLRDVYRKRDRLGGIAGPGLRALHRRYRVRELLQLERHEGAQPGPVDLRRSPTICTSRRARTTTS